MYGKFQPPPGVQLPSPHSRKPEAPPLGGPLPSPHPRRPEDDRRHPRPFGAAGRSLLQTTIFDGRSPSPPPNPGLRSDSRMDEEDALGETNYRDQMRAQLKSSSCLLAADHRHRAHEAREQAREQAPVCGLPPEFQALQEQATPRRRTSKGRLGSKGGPDHLPPASAAPAPVFDQPPTSARRAPPSPSPSPLLPAMSQSPTEEPSRGEGAAALARAKSDAKARMSACFEDLISFLEMNGLSGAYALAFAAAGVQDLSQFLLLEDEELELVIKTSDMDAMDEILLRDALGHSRPPK